MNAKRLAREVAPRPVAGIIDREWFSKETPEGELAVNPKNLKAQVIRNDADKTAKLLGFTGINESVQKQKLYDAEWTRKAYEEKRQKPLNKAREELFLTGKVRPETVQDYLQYEGDVNTLMTDIRRMAKEQNIPDGRLDLLRASMSRSLTQQKHAERLRKAVK